MAFKGSKLWLILVVLGTFLAGFLSKHFDSPIPNVVGLLLSAVAIVFYAWPSKKSSASSKPRSRSSESGRVVHAKRALRAEAALSAARDSLSTYQPLIVGISHALRLDPEASWRNFSEAFLKKASLKDGLDASYSQHPLFAWFDWKDADGLDQFVDHVRKTLHPDQHFALQKDVSVEVGLKAFDAWLRAHGSRVVIIDIGDDSYHCLALRQEDALVLAQVQTPKRVEVATFDDD